MPKVLTLSETEESNHFAQLELKIRDSSSLSRSKKLRKKGKTCLQTIELKASLKEEELDFDGDDESSVHSDDSESYFCETSRSNSYPKSIGSKKKKPAEE